ncbi:hypothetical protein [Natrinema saccharevitans]|uniref:hypothetical protein n=1 Tax=Natrinema saccharevitans TaxID=301967 RepID=UPI001FEC342B|nr:hypothetical protein [Natrinema saccharevitans]
MSTDNRETNQSDPPFADDPDPSNNEKFLEERLSTLRERYSYERLSDLSARRLGAINPDEEGMSERDFLHQEFKELYERFPDENSDHTMRRWVLGDDYQGLAPLTLEQKQRIHDCHHECSRNLDRARQDALEREDLTNPLSKFAAWLVDFADAVTPVFSIQR